ncbi:hypothetical protein MASR2M64_18060 [Candidatus Cloacimonadota bacterium]|nr:hypothetical protein [Candidatus Cloacimonadota bacterium]
MKLRKLMLILVVLSIALFMVACGSNKKKAPKPDGNVVYRPTWWASQPEPAYVCSYGQGTNASENSSMNTAKANALLEAAQYVEIQVNGMIKTYEEEAGVNDPQILALTQSVVKAISSARFSGTIPGNIETRVVQEKGGTRYKTWTQIKIPKGEINKSVVNNIRNEEALYNQFKASQAFKELEAAVDKY